MPNKNYNNAAQYERDLVKKLLRDGALWATRTPGSKSPVDVVAVFPQQEAESWGSKSYQDLQVHMVQCKLGKSRPKRSEIDFLKFMREKGVDAYFMTRSNNKPHKKYHRMELEEVEAGPIKDDGLDDIGAMRAESHRWNRIDAGPRCEKHHRYMGIHRPRVKRGIEGCTCYEIFSDRVGP